MGYMFYETGGVEAGIDGFIDLRDVSTGAVGNLLLQVQVTATASRGGAGRTFSSIPCGSATEQLSVRCWRGVDLAIGSD